MFIRFTSGHLPVPTLKIQSGKPTGAMKSVEEVIDVGQGVHVFYCGRVELPKFNTESQLAFLLCTMTTGEAQGLLEGLMMPPNPAFVAPAQPPPATQSGSTNGKEAIQVGPVSRWFAQAQRFAQCHHRLG